MKKPIKSGKELHVIILFAIVTVVFVVGLSINNMYQFQAMHKVTQDIYEHPLKVSNAALNIKLEVLNIHKIMHNISLHASGQKRNDLILRMQKSESKVDNYFKIIQNRILGEEGMELVKTTEFLYEQGQVVRSEFIKEVKANNLQKAINVNSMQNHEHIQIVESFTSKLYEYANKKAISFHDESSFIYQNFQIVSLIVTIILLLLFSILSIYVYVHIKNYIKALKESEANLLDTTYKYELAIKGTKDGLWDWDLEKGTIYFSAYWKEMLGYTDEELPNEFSSWEERVHPDDLPKAEKAIEQAHANPEFKYEIVHRLRHKDGHWVWILDRGKTIFDTEGKAVRMLGFHTDISAQKEQEIKINKLTALLNSTINSIDAIVFAKDKEFKYLECNRAFEEFMGHSREELLGKDDYDFFPKEQADFFREHDSGVFNTLKAKSDLHKIKKANGEEIYQLATVSPLIDELGNIFGIVGTAVDITKMKNLEDEVSQQQELMIAQSRHAAMGEMISMIAHQWRQPLAVISMDANNILADIELDSIDEKSIEEDMNHILAQTQHLSQTIDDFRDFFKPNKLKDEVLVSDVMRDSISVVGKSFANNDVEMETIFEDITKIEIYSRELLQVFLNILKNAKEALLETRENNRKINTKVYEDEENIIIEISDNAGGIKEEILEKIFDPYFSTKDEKNGTGLGLYMSETIIEKHLHGAIEVRNIQDGVMFIIALPKKWGGAEIDED